jgi:hypothetical protein
VTTTGGGLPLAVPASLRVPFQPPIIDGEFSEVPRLSLRTQRRCRLPQAEAAGGRLHAPIGARPSWAHARPVLNMIGLLQQRCDLKQSDMQGLTDAYKQAMAKQVQPQPMPPVQPLDDAPQRGAPQMPWWASGDMTKMFPGAPTPMPQPRLPQPGMPNVLHPGRHQAPAAVPTGPPSTLRCRWPACCSSPGSAGHQLLHAQRHDDA